MTQDPTDDGAGWSLKLRVALVVVGVLVGAIVGGAVVAQLDQGEGTPVSGDVAVGHAPDGPAVSTTGDMEVAFEPMFPDANTVDLRTTDGNVTFESQGRTDVRVTSITGTTTDLDQLDVGSNDLTVDPEDKPVLTVGGGADSVSWRDPTVDDGVTDLSYAASGSETTITMHGLPADTGLKLIADDGTVLATTTTDGSGTATFASLPTGSYDAQAVTGEPPVLSNPSPEDGTTISDYETELSVDLSDEDFGTTGGDSVTVTFWDTDDGTQIHQEAVSEGGTVTTTWSGLDMGSNSWNVTAEDEFGRSDAVGPFEVVTPSEIEIRDETDQSLIDDTTANVSVSYFDPEGSTVIERTVTGGTVNMSGVPIGREILVQADADGYNQRTVLIRDITEQQTVYLLSENVSTVESRFVLDDVSGQFDTGSLLFVRRPITINGTTEYTTIVADEFGAEGLQATLEEGIRYRLSIYNIGGSEQDIGPYRARTSETITIVPGSPAVDLDTGEEGWVGTATIDDDNIVARYIDDQNRTDSVALTVYERGNESNVLFETTTYTDTNDIATAIPLTANQTDKEWVVSFEITRDGETFTTTKLVANQRADTGFDGLDGKWSAAIAIFMLVLFAGAFSVINRAAGAIMTGLMGGVLWWFGWLSGVTSAAAITLYLFVAIIYSIYLMNRP